jgi:MFS transporter, UMF1 family
MASPPTSDAEARRRIRAWCLYDWANSAFACTVMAAMYPPFFRGLATAAGVPAHLATAYWGYATGLSLLLVAVVAPILGAVADVGAARKRLLAIAALTGCAVTASFALIPGGAWPLAAALFIIADVAFASSIIFYESLLPSLAAGRDLDAISSRGYALGYLGGGLLLVVNAAWVTWPATFGLATTGAAVRLSFVSVGVWWALFSLPLLRGVPEPAGAARPPALAAAWRQSWGRLRATWHDLAGYRPLVTFLAAYWVYSDGIGTIVKMSTAYGSEIGIGVRDLILALVLTQFVAWPGTLAFGRLARRLGARPVLQGGLVVYALICVLGFFLRTAAHFYALAALVGLVQGGCQALSRSLFASMVPQRKSAEFFGFFSTSSRAAGIAGPLLFALLGQFTGQSRWAILVLTVFFLGGAWLLGRVDLAAGRRRAQAEDAAV